MRSTLRAHRVKEALLIRGSGRRTSQQTAPERHYLSALVDGDLLITQDETDHEKCVHDLSAGTRLVCRSTDNIPELMRLSAPASAVWVITHDAVEKLDARTLDVLSGSSGAVG